MKQENKEFLKQLQHEMLTQDHICQANPRFWVVMQTVRDYWVDDDYNGICIYDTYDSERIFEGNLDDSELIDWLKKEFDVIEEIKCDSGWIDIICKDERGYYISDAHDIENFLEEYNTNKIWAKNHRINENGVIEKYCSSCNKWIEENTNNFYLKNKSYPEKGFVSECKQCNMVRSTRWIKNNPEKYKKIMQKTDAKNHRVKNRREWSKQSRENGQRKEWELNNPNKLAKYTAYRHLHKMHDIADKQWQLCKEYFNNSCAYCGLSQKDHWIKRKDKMINMDLHKEHVDDKGSNGLENCVPSCNECNSSKRTNDFKIWYSPNSTRRGGEIYSEERFKKIIEWITEDYKEYI